MIYNDIFKQRLKLLENEQLKISKIMKANRFPDGNILISKSRNKYKWFHTVRENGKTIRHYIPRKDEQFAKELAIKKYYSRASKSIKNEINAVKLYLKYSPKELPDKLFYESPEYKRLLINDIPFLQHQISEWENQPYEKNPKKPEHLIVKTLKGDMVRSKSESMIADTLYRSGIPYKYECPLVLKSGEVIYPDFFIRDPRDGKIYIWEHFGLMDDPKYFKKFLYKMQILPQNGYLPNRNLLITCETESEPLGLSEVYDTIKHFFGIDPLF